VLLELELALRCGLKILRRRPDVRTDFGADAEGFARKCSSIRQAVVESFGENELKRVYNIVV
jgi:hypothetical protein